MSQFQRHLETVFCDDIRQEVGNKLSYMGIYFSEMTIPTAPLVLPKLCVAIKAVTAATDPFQSIDMQLVKVKNGEETLLASTGQISMPTDASPEVDGVPMMVFQSMFMLNPFQIDEECTLRVKAITEREELRGLGLRINVVQPPSIPTPSPV